MLSNGTPSHSDTNLRERRGVALAVGVCAGEDRKIAVRVEAQIHALVENASFLDEIGEAAPAQQPGGLGLGLTGGKAVPVDEAKALVHGDLELAAVVDVARERRVGHRLGPDQVAAA